jgi:hypothetical protein
MYKKYKRFTKIKSLLIISIIFSSQINADSQNCPTLFHHGVLDLPFNPAFTNIESMNDGKSLLVSSFHNTYKRDSGGYDYFHNDAIATINSNLQQILKY